MRSSIKTNRTAVSLLACGVLVLSCSDEDAGGSSNGSGGRGGGGAGTAGVGGSGVAPGTGGADAASTDEIWSTLVAGDWSMPPGQEGYVCVRATVDKDTYIRGFGAIAPPGTHHTLLTAEGPSDRPNEVYDCSVAENGPNMLFGSGVGTEDITFPDGVAIKLEAGDQVLLNLHLFNTSSEELTGNSGIRILEAEPSSVVHEAEIILAGKVAGLTVEPGVTQQLGGCEMSHDVTIFAAAPHMHQLGSHMKAVAEPAGGEATVLFDAPYSFEEQIYYPVSPGVQLAAGDRVSVECEYTNPGSETIGFGDSSTEEMCFTGLYRYPKGDGTFFICSEGAAGTLPFDAPACAATGDEGNEVGVGRYCTDGGGECSADAFCLADIVTADFANFCTRTCTDDADCGAGASCRGSAGTTACVPDHCALGSGDGG